MSDQREVKATAFYRRSADEQFLESIGEWEVWICEDPEFWYSYDDGTTLYVHEGAASLQFETGEAINLEPGDVLTIHPGNKASWAISPPIRNSFRSGQSGETVFTGKDDTAV